MTNLAYSKILQRNVRLDNLNELGVPTPTKIKAAIEAGRTQEALALVDYLNPEGKAVHDIMCQWPYANLSFIADRFGEEQVYHALRYAFEVVGQSSLFKALLGAKSLEELIPIIAESWRVHRMGPGETGEFSIVDDGDKYVLTMDPCGTGGRIRRAGLGGNLGVTKIAYPWSWGKVGVPYYCAHCCVFNEIIPTERNGYPARITLYNDDPNEPHRMLIYKNPENIPEEYFTRIGFKKDLSRIKKRR